jgi:release factor glutamine methyltransferase
MTYKEFQQKVTLELASIYDNDEAEQITWMLLEEASGFSRSKLRTLDREEISETFTFRVYKYLHSLMQHQPVQYAFGYAWFYKQKFFVDAAVLIPRKETEELVYRVVKEYRGRKASILDMGTGSGCIAISLQLELPEADVMAIDISSEALKVAVKNAANLNAAKVRFEQLDILNQSACSGLEKFDAIVSNPPYITEVEKADMKNNVLQHEPHQALFVTNNDPLQFYKAITALALKHLNKGGMLFLECNESFASQVAELLQQNNFTETEILKDMQGKDRMVTAKFQQ